MNGEPVTLGSLTAAPGPVLLLFTDPRCRPCHALMPSVAAWQRQHAQRLAVAVISRGLIGEVRATAAEHGLSGVLHDEDLSVYDAYRATGTPGAVLIDRDGRIASPVAGGATAITELVDRVVAGQAPAALIQVDRSPPPRRAVSSH